MLAVVGGPELDQAGSAVGRRELGASQNWGQARSLESLRPNETGGEVSRQFGSLMRSRARFWQTRHPRRVR